MVVCKHKFGSGKDWCSLTCKNDDVHFYRIAVTVFMVFILTSQEFSPQIPLATLLWDDGNIGFLKS